MGGDDVLPLPELDSRQEGTSTASSRTWRASVSSRRAGERRQAAALLLLSRLPRRQDGNFCSTTLDMPLRASIQHLPSSSSLAAATTHTWSSCLSPPRTPLRRVPPERTAHPPRCPTRPAICATSASTPPGPSPRTSCLSASRIPTMPAPFATSRGSGTERWVLLVHGQTRACRAVWHDMTMHTPAAHRCLLSSIQLPTCHAHPLAMHNRSRRSRPTACSSASRWSSWASCACCGCGACSAPTWT